MVNNILLTGAPSSGKTTVIKKIVERLPCPANGFYTQEERKGGKRVGFLMKTLDGKQGYLAHQDIQSPFNIRRYRVSVGNIEDIAVPAIIPRKGAVIILDEIGKMECFSEAFKKAALAALAARNIVIGTITLGGDDFIQEIKQRRDSEVIEVTLENRHVLPDEMLERITHLLKGRPEGF